MNWGKLARRIGAAIMAFAGVILATPKPIDLSDLYFWAAAALVIVPALLDTADTTRKS